MKNFVNTFSNSVRSFATDEDGAQVVEYALIIALVSIALAVLLADKTTGLGKSFSDLVTRVSNCFAANATTC